MKIVDVNDLEKKVKLSQKALAEIALRTHQIQEALNQLAKETNSKKN